MGARLSKIDIMQRHMLHRGVDTSWELNDWLALDTGLLWSTYDDEWWVDLVILILTWLSSYRRCGDCS